MKSIFSPTYFINIFCINLRNSPFSKVRDLTIINIVIFFIYNIRRTTSGVVFSVSPSVSTRNFGAPLLCSLLTVVGTTLVVK